MVRYVGERRNRTPRKKDLVLGTDCLASHTTHIHTFTYHTHATYKCGAQLHNRRQLWTNRFQPSFENLFPKSPINPMKPWHHNNKHEHDKHIRAHTYNTLNYTAVWGQKRRAGTFFGFFFSPARKWWRWSDLHRLLAQVQIILGHMLMSIFISFSTDRTITPE